MNTVRAVLLALLTVGGLSGAAVLGEGDVVTILDVETL